MVENQIDEAIYQFHKKYFSGHADLLTSQEGYILLIKQWKWNDSDWGINMGKRIDERMAPAFWGDSVDDVSYSDDSVDFMRNLIHMIHYIQKRIRLADEGACLISESEYIREYRKSLNDRL